jgi:hypothetical protein
MNAAAPEGTPPRRNNDYPKKFCSGELIRENADSVGVFTTWWGIIPFAGTTYYLQPASALLTEPCPPAGDEWPGRRELFLTRKNFFAITKNSLECWFYHKNLFDFSKNQGVI